MPRPFIPQPLVLSFVSILALTISSACVISVDASHVTVRDEKRFEVSGTPQVTLTTFDGAIEVRSWDRPEVVVEIEKRASDEAHAKQIEVRVEQSGDQIKIEAKSPQRGAYFGFNTSPSVKLIASVPRQVDLTAHSGDGAITVERVKGRVTLESGDGAIRATDVHGPLRAHSGDGSIRIEGADGQIDADSGDGGVWVGGKLAGLRVHTSDGSVTVRAETGSAMSDDWEVRTGDGGVSIELPSAFDAELDASTGDGSVQLDNVSLTATSRSSKHALQGTMGSGGKQLRVRTGDGSITVRKG
jgi:DUF4097 and DUF4098 domain-containing protein YvlB